MGISKILEKLFIPFDSTVNLIAAKFPALNQIIKRENEKIFRAGMILLVILNFAGTVFLCPLWLYIALIEIVLIIVSRSMQNDIFSNIRSMGKLQSLTLIALSLFYLVNTLLVGVFWFLLVLLSLLLLFSNDPNSQIDHVLFSNRKHVIFSLVCVVLLVMVYTVPTAISNTIVLPNEQFSSSITPVTSYQLYGSGEADREHVVPQSWFQSDMNFHNDYVNVMMSNKKANNYRGNLPYCDVEVSVLNQVKDGTVVVGYRTQSCFMPTDEFKGDVARITLYIYVKYYEYLKPVYRNQVNIKTMKEWSNDDPVSLSEQERNKRIKNQYNYTNKYVNVPLLLRYIS